jgi:DNA-directed RNA polymerase subunit RPC12/RpoP
MTLQEITDLIVAVEKYDVCSSPSAPAPRAVHLEVGANVGLLIPCPECGVDDEASFCGCPTREIAVIGGVSLRPRDDRDDRIDELQGDLYGKCSRCERPNDDRGNGWEIVAERGYEDDPKLVCPQCYRLAKPGAEGDGTPDAFLKNTALKALRSLEAVMKWRDGLYVDFSDHGEMPRFFFQGDDADIIETFESAISTAWGENNGG